jgi:hypothetical protein
MSVIAEGCRAVGTNQIASSQSYPDTPLTVSSILTPHAPRGISILVLRFFSLGVFCTVCRSILWGLLIAHQTKPLFNPLKREPLCLDQHSDKTAGERSAARLEVMRVIRGAVFLAVQCLSVRVGKAIGLFELHCTANLMECTCDIGRPAAVLPEI